MRSRSPQLRAPRFVSGRTLLGGVAFCADCGGAMTLRTSGKGTEYRYYTCCTAARQGPKGCKGRSIPMDELNDLVVSSVVDRLLSPHFLEEALSALLKRRDEAAERETGRSVALKRNALDAENKLTRLYEAIEAGLADLTDSNLKGRIAELADVERAEGRRGGRIEITRRPSGRSRRQQRTGCGAKMVLSGGTTSSSLRSEPRWEPTKSG
ncbi:zinc ribbon domain-containing protein [Bosea sp. RCC_152_1]|uniref:zinc ribbon domain-containing protein n=1 Tax=Bosea sp. RCC_152_1 TaxID=3239228 RepID=UPI0035260B7B